jgi:hypothetical protein
VPIPEVAAVGPDNDRFPRHRQRLTSGGTLIPGTRLVGAEVGILPDSNPVQVLADGLRVGHFGDRQNVLEQGSRQAEEDQRGPAALQIQQVRCGALGEELGQWAEPFASQPSRSLESSRHKPKVSSRSPLLSSCTITSSRITVLSSLKMRS